MLIVEKGNQYDEFHVVLFFDSSPMNIQLMLLSCFLLNF